MFLRKREEGTFQLYSKYLHKKKTQHKNIVRIYVITVRNSNNYNLIESDAKIGTKAIARDIVFSLVLAIPEII